MKWKIRLNVTKVFSPRIKYNHGKFFSSIPVQNEFFSKEENLKAELHSSSSPARPKLRVKDILSKKPSSEWTISDLATVDEAISHLTEKQISASLAIDSEGEVSGLFTARDLLRFMHLIGSNRGYGKDKALNHRIKDFMVPKDKLLICSPNDTALQARQVMSQSKIRHIPVVEGGEVLGIINIKDLADSSFSILDLGGKKGFIQNVTGRKGVPAGTKIRKSDIEDNAIRGLLHQKLEVEVGDFALPHPFKKSHSVGASRRDYGAIELCNDMSLCEDAHFTMFVDGSPSPFGPTKQLYMCIADGVGSWREYRVDPREFSHGLVRNAKKTIEMDAIHRESLRTYPMGDATQGLGLGGLVMDDAPIRPLDVMVDAWNMTIQEQVLGSSTFCVATLDHVTNQLSYSNLGDCGLVIMRHIDSETAGYMRERQLPRHLRKNDLRIAYLAQQQLRSFNLPYQLGYFAGPAAAGSEHKGRFETPKDADTASIPVLPGDIVLLATDGLFDNLDLNEIVEIVSEWEHTWFTSSGEDLKNPSPRGNEALQTLSRTLVNRARAVSLDTQRDSPFAVLAKENDIMWGGGMPDDTSVIVARIYKPTTLE